VTPPNLPHLPIHFQVTDMREPREVIWRVLQCVRALLFGARAVSADWPTCRAMVAR
jgi:hypothetical protein